MNDLAASDAVVQRCAALQARPQTLPDKPEETAASTLRVLWHLAAGQAMSVEAADSMPLTPLDAAAEAHLAKLTAQRLSGVPLAHLSGRQRFMGLELLASKDALIPRRETELLGRAALDLLHGMAPSGRAMRVVDVCTGSGNLALSLAHHSPRAQVFAADLSADAISLARRNAEHVSLQTRVEFRVGDLMEPFNTPEFHGLVDLLVCNPPYISSQKVGAMAGEIRDFEPRLAFDGGPLGVRILQRLIREAPPYLSPGGWLAIEVGQGQGPAVLKRLQAGSAFTEHRCVADAQGEIRVLLAAR